MEEEIRAAGCARPQDRHALALSLRRETSRPLVDRLLELAVRSTAEAH